MTKIVPSDLLNPTEKTIKNWNCSFIATEGPNILDKLSLEDLEIPYESQYRARIILKAGEINQPLIYGFIGKSVTFLMIKVTYDGDDPYYRYEQEKYNISYYFENDPVLRSLGRLLIMTGSIEEKIPQIYLNNPLDYDVTLDVLHATMDSEYDSGTTYGGFGMINLEDVMFSGVTSGDTLMYIDGVWQNVPFTFSGNTNIDATVHNDFYYSSGDTSLHVSNIVASGLTLTGLTETESKNYIVVDSDGKLYKTDVVGVTDNVNVANVDGGVRTLHFLNGLYTGYTDVTD